MFVHYTILSGIVSFALLAGPAATIAVPESVYAIQARDTSGIDIQQACNSFYGNAYTAETTGSSCWDWVCVSGGSSRGLNLNVWCADVYGLNSYATCDGGVYNWVCNY